ncbi:MAG: DUF4412 domain-containing protein [Bacteroidia bacterium]
MKKILITITAFVVSTAAALAQFEGSYTITIESAKLTEPMDINMTVKGNLSCMQIPSMESSGMVKNIINSETQSMIMCNDRGGRKIGMKMNMKDAERFAPQEAKPFTVTETTETKVIDGYKCKKIIMENDESKNELWITNELPISMKDLLNSISANRSPGSIMLRNLKRGYGDQNGVALQTFSTNKSSKEEFTMTIHNITKTKVDDKVFNTDDFQLMDMPNMGGGAIHK